MAEPILSRNFNIPDAWKLDVAVKRGAYETARRVLTSKKPQDIVDAVKAANLRGLGGAGFPTGVKWGFLPKDSPKPRYLVVNADEGEPGTFKDRYILELDPHLLIEGILISAFAINARKSYVYVRGEYILSAKRLEAAIQEAKAKGILGKGIFGTSFDLEIVLHRGAGAYICGEETALLESLEGKKGYPRLKPPFPAVVGLFQCPTIINNVETLACVPFIMKNGPEWFAKLGAPGGGGTHLYSISGHVERPGVYELPMGTTLRDMIYKHAGGIKGGKQLKAVIPGGISSKILTAAEIDVKMDYDSLKAAGTMLGSAGVVVMDETTSIVKMLLVASKFFAHESCGQCSPCREGTGWAYKIMKRVWEGDATSKDLDDLLYIAKNMEGRTICVFADAAAWPVQSYITKFRAEFEEHLRNTVIASPPSPPVIASPPQAGEAIPQSHGEAEGRSHLPEKFCGIASSPLGVPRGSSQ